MSDSKPDAQEQKRLDSFLREPAGVDIPVVDPNGATLFASHYGTAGLSVYEVVYLAHMAASPDMEFEEAHRYTYLTLRHFLRMREAGKLTECLPS